MPGPPHAALLRRAVFLGAIAIAGCRTPRSDPSESATAPAEPAPAPAAAAGHVAGPDGPETGSWRERAHWVPMLDADGHAHLLAARVCRPAGEARARVVVLAHGSPPNAAERPKMTLTNCDSERAKWFLGRGYVVISALRRGYGATGGAWAETFGRCEAADFHRAGLETARDLDAVVEYATSLPYARGDGVVVVGHSAGGWGTVAYDSLPHRHVTAMINMAGGRGGHSNGTPNENCHPERLVDTAARYARTASTPMLWVYAENDSFFRPELARQLHEAFTRGGGKARLEQVGPFGDDGHLMWNRPNGAPVWGPLVERYLAEVTGD